MQLLANNSSHNTPYGDFELLPEAGWTIVQTFLDYESKLLVVVTKNEQPSDWKDTGLGSQIIPSKYHLVEVENKKILTFEEWKSYFSYHPKVVLSENGQYECTLKRTHLEHQGLDIIQEEVVDIQQGKVIFQEESIAFNPYPRETFLDQLALEEKARIRRANRNRKQDESE